MDPEALRGRLDGELVLPGDGGYDESRAIWNAMHDRRPALIVRPRSTGDVVAALAFAREAGLPVAIRGGGHSVAGYGTVDGGLVIDHSLMRGVEVDGDRRIVRAEAGATLADLDRATQEHGLAVPIGVISATGIAGLTLGGGVGWLTRAYGLTADNLVAAEMVTADGSVVRASEVDEPELFWGLRGGGGNFGVVVAFELRAYPLGPTTHGGNLVYHRPHWTDALRAFRDWTADLPDSTTAIVTFMTPPPSWELGAETLMIIGFSWAGTDADEAARTVAPLRRALPADVELLDPVPWVAWQSAADELFPKGVRAYWKNVALDALGDEAIEAIVRAADAMAPRKAGLDIHHMGGAFAACAAGGDPVPEPQRRLLGQLLRSLGRAGGRRGRAELGPRRPRRAAAPRRGGGVRELPGLGPRRRRSAGRRAGHLWGGEARPAPRAEAALGPGERVSPEPQHRSCRLTAWAGPLEPRILRGRDFFVVAAAYLS